MAKDCEKCEWHDECCNQGQFKDGDCLQFEEKKHETGRKDYNCIANLGGRSVLGRILRQPEREHLTPERLADYCRNTTASRSNARRSLRQETQRLWDKAICDQHAAVWLNADTMRH